jgi:hypothetical protein
MKDWLEEFARALGIEPLSRDETALVLKLARDVAHGVERKFAPLSAYLLGVAVGDRAAAGPSRPDAFGTAIERAWRTVPGAGDDADATRSKASGED